MLSLLLPGEPVPLWVVALAGMSGTGLLCFLEGIIAVLSRFVKGGNQNLER